MSTSISLYLFRVILLVALFTVSTHSNDHKHDLEYFRYGEFSCMKMDSFLSFQCEKGLSDQEKALLLIQDYRKMRNLLPEGVKFNYRPEYLVGCFKEGNIIELLAELFTNPHFEFPQANPLSAEGSKFVKARPHKSADFFYSKQRYVFELGATVQLSPSPTKANNRTDVAVTENRGQVMLLEFFNHSQKLDASPFIFRQNNLSETTTPPILLLAKAPLVSQEWPYSSLIHSHLLALSSPPIPLQNYQVVEFNSGYSLNQRVLKPIEIKPEQNYALQVMLSVYFFLILWGALRSKSLHFRLAST